ncbi:Vegetative incompatibility protein [Paramyrothecium foliicola]|nr:Vegetative incompatibility protein [Paramyrothecium foliicola]
MGWLTNRLGASFFFKRGEADRGNATKFMTTIARQLADKEPRLAPMLMSAIETDSTISSLAIREQFKKLIFEPLSKIILSGPLVIIVDALDECEGDEKIRIIIDLFTGIQSQHIPGLKVFLTSRPDLPIHLGFAKAQGTYQDFILHEIKSEIIEQDILKFLKHQFKSIQDEYNLTAVDTPLPPDWPGDSRIKALVDLAKPLFISAATACLFISERRHGHPDDLLKEILAYRGKSASSGLSATYLPILNRQLVGIQSKQKKEEIIQQFRKIVGTIVILESPLSSPALAQLLDCRQDAVNTLEGHSDSVNSVAFSPDAKHLTSASNDNTVRLWDAATGQCIQTLEGHSRSVWSVAFSPDAKYLASVSDDKTVRLWNAATGQCIQTLEGHSHSVSLVVFSPDAKYLASVSDDKTVRLWNAATGQCIQTLEGHSHSVSLVVFSPDAKYLASASHDKTIRLWDAATGQCIQTLEGHSHSVSSVVFSPDAKYLASASDDWTVRLWDSATGQCLQLFNNTATYRLSFTPDSSHLSTDAGILMLENAPVGFLSLIGNQTKSVVLSQLGVRCEGSLRRRHGELHLHLALNPLNKPLIIADGDLPAHSRLPRVSKPYRCHEVSERRFMNETDDTVESAINLADTVHHRILLPFVDVQCLFVADIGGVDTTVRRLATWAAVPVRSTAADIRPVLVLVVTRGQVKKMKAALNALPEFDKRTSALGKHFRQVRIIVFNPTRRTNRKNGKQQRVLRRALIQSMNSVHRDRNQLGLLFSAFHTAHLLQAAAERAVASPWTPLNFIATARKHNSVAVDMDAHLMNFLEQFRDNDSLQRLAIPLVASAILLDQYPPGMHPFHPRDVFKILYRDACAKAHQNLASFRVGMDLPDPPNDFTALLEAEFDRQYHAKQLVPSKTWHNRQLLKLCPNIAFLASTGDAITDLSLLRFFGPVSLNFDFFNPVSLSLEFFSPAWLSLNFFSPVNLDIVMLLSLDFFSLALFNFAALLAFILFIGSAINQTARNTTMQVISISFECLNSHFLLLQFQVIFVSNGVLTQIPRQRLGAYLQMAYRIWKDRQSIYFIALFKPEFEDTQDSWAQAEAEALKQAEMEYFREAFRLWLDDHETDIHDLAIMVVIGTKFRLLCVTKHPRFPSKKEAPLHTSFDVADFRLLWFHRQPWHAVIQNPL